MKTILLIAALLTAQPDTDAKAALAIAAAQQKAKACDDACQCKQKDGKCSCSGGKCTCKVCTCKAPTVTEKLEELSKPVEINPVEINPFARYKMLSEQAIRENIPLVVGVGCVPAVPTGFLGCRCDYEIDLAPGIWVSVPHNGELRVGHVPLPKSASVGQVRDEAERVKESLKPRPVSYVQPQQYQPQQSYQPRYVQSRSC